MSGEPSATGRGGPPRPARVDVLGLGVDPVDLPAAVDVIGGWVERGERAYVSCSGVHGVMEHRRDPSLRPVYANAGLVVADGMPVAWLCRRAGHALRDRVYGPDLMLAVLERAAARGWSSFFYGGAEGVADELATRLAARFPGLRVAGTWCPPFRPLTPEEDAEVVARIDASGADLVWVGISTPKQERWMAEHVGRLRKGVLLGVGAAFDFHTGRVRQAPRWMQRASLEWLFRVIQEPRRLWRRYLVNNTAFVALLAARALGFGRR